MEFVKDSAVEGGEGGQIDHEIFVAEIFYLIF
jgi:hypothetical protein